MNGTRNKSPADEEVIDVLIAISQVSARLARKLTILAAQRQSEEGGKRNEQNESKLHELARFLLEKETITGEEFMAILEAPQKNWAEETAGN